MSSLKQAARTAERLGTTPHVDRIRWEELETRVLLSRALAANSILPDLQSDQSFDVTNTALVDRNSVSTSTLQDPAQPAPDDPMATPPATGTTTATSEPVVVYSDKSDPTGTREPSRQRRIASDSQDSVLVDNGLNTSADSDVAPATRSSTTAPAPTGSDQTATNAQRIAKRTEVQSDSTDSAAKPTRGRGFSAGNAAPGADATLPTRDENPDCTPRRMDRKSVPECGSHEPLTLIILPPDDTADTRTTDRAEGNPPAQQLIVVEPVGDQHPDSTVPDNAGPRSDDSKVDAPPSQPAAPMHDAPSNNLLPGALDDPHSQVSQSQATPNVLTASVLAVALTRPLSRLATPASSELGEWRGDLAVPIFVPRRRRRENGKSRAGTKDIPDDMEEDVHDGRRSYRRRNHVVNVDEGLEKPADAFNGYEPIEAAIISFLEAGNDNSEQPSAPQPSAWSSVKSFATGALTTACALFTYHDMRPRSRRPLKPMQPSYVGPTLLQQQIAN